MLTIILTILCLLLFACLTVSVIKNLEQMGEIDNIADVLKSCLVELEFIHDRTEAKSKLEVLSDDPIVRELVADIQDAKNILQSVCERIEPLTQLDEDEEEQQESKEEE